MEKVYITWEEIEELVNILAQQITHSGIKIEYIFGLQRGGLIPAVMLSHKLGIPMTQDPHLPNILIIDDICDSGETFKRYFTFDPEYTFACLHFKPHTSDFNPTFTANQFISDAWLVYPWEREDSKTIQDYKF